MPTAKSYSELKILRDPYEINGRSYVDVETARGASKTVRWYSNEEYIKMYPGEEVPSSVKMSQYKAFGFDKNGYITIVKGETYPHKDWLKENGARYTKFWGWYFIDEVPADFPYGISPVRLDWSLVAASENSESIKNEDALKPIIEGLVFEADPSEYVGQVGQRIETEIVVQRKIELNGFYGSSHMYIMRDPQNNMLVWTTASKDWQEGNSFHIRGTVKEFSMYHGAKETILTRCTVVK